MGAVKQPHKGRIATADIKPDSEHEEGDKSKPKEQPSLCRYPSLFASRWMKLFSKTGGD